jgi:hypothetical protein
LFALRAIRKGTRIIEYKGERISSDEAERRYRRSMQYPYTYLFEVDEHTIIDATDKGNSARYINHACQPNCESVREEGRIYIEAIKDISRGDELTYDYRLQVEGRPTATLRAEFGCNCGSRRCRGTMLDLSGQSRRSARKRGA